MGEGASSILNYAQQVKAAKCLNGSFEICEELKRQNPAVFIVARTLHTRAGMRDCPEPWMYDSPSAWWDQIEPYLPRGFDAYEVQNECGPPPGDDYEKWAWWSIEMAKIVERERNAPMLAFSFAAGNPDYPFWDDLLPYLTWVAEHPLADGRYHGLALHSAAYATWARADSPWVSNPYLAGRHQQVCDTLKATDDFDCSAWPGLLVMTEVGLTGGYSGNWNATYSCAETADAYRETRRQYAGDPVDIMLWWNLGKISNWLDDSCALPLIF